jgi:hypothetical protein
VSWGAIENDDETSSWGADAGAAGWDTEEDRDTSWWDTGQSIANELVKSYGLRHENGQWSWSLENVAKSFKEDPIWTSLDYVMLAAPVAKWGIASYKVARGSTAAGRMYHAGAAAGRAPTRLGARAAEGLGRLVGAKDGFGHAVEMQAQYGARGKIGEYFSSKAGRRLDDPDYEEMLRVGGADPMEQRGLHTLWAREQKMEAEAWIREGQDISALQRRALKTDAARETFTTALMRGADSTDPALAALGKDAQEVYEKTWTFRRKIHDELYRAGLISDEAYEAGLKQYWPRSHAELDAAGKFAKARGAKRTPEGDANLKARHWTYDEAEQIENAGILTRVLDPNVGTMKLAKAAMKLSRHTYLQRLAGSAIAKTSDEILSHITDLVGQAQSGDKLAQSLLKTYDPKQLEGFTAYLRAHREVEGVLPQAALENGVREFLGWRKMSDLPGARHLPKELRDKFIDPAVAEDVLGMAKISESWGEMAGTLGRVYQGGIGAFKYTKTVMNPATHFRNIFGSMVFHHLTVGGLGVFNPKNMMYTRGRAALKAGPGNADYMDALKAGLLGSSHDRELYEHLAKSIDSELAQGATVPDLIAKIPGIGDSWIGRKAQAGLSRAERFYRGVDEMAKMDAFLTRRDAWKKKLTQSGFKGDVHQEAVSRAASDVAKFQPMFVQNSPFTNLVRNAIPFASFTTETVRIWKNALVENPHRAFFWNHFVESASQVSAAAAGFSPDEIEAAHGSLAHFQQGKKSLVWPWRVDGKPVFLDMSYMIPLANIAEAEAAEATFFDYAQIDPFTNPFASIAAAASTGVDPFTKRPVEPRFLQQQLGVAVEPGRGQRALGLGEHMLKMMLPPLVPPGYSGVNLMEWVRGTRHPLTGEELEQGALRTVGANLAGIRLYEADVQSQMLNVKREEKLTEQRTQFWWDQWRQGAANGDAGTMRKALGSIAAIRRDQGDDDVEGYLAEGISSREPGKYRTVPTAQLEEVLRRSRRLGYTDPADRAAVGELMARLQERRTRSKSKKSKREKKRGTWKWEK